MSIGLIALLPVAIGLCAPPISDRTNDGWLPRAHGLTPGVYAHPVHLLVVKRRWIYEWSAGGRAAVGYVAGGRFIRVPGVGAQSRADLLAGGAATRLVRSSRGLCVGDGCAVELVHHPADFEPRADGRVWRADGWTAGAQTHGLALDMRLQAKGDAAVVKRDAMRALLAQDHLSREPPRDLASGLLLPLGGVHQGQTVSPAAPAPTSVPIVMWRFHVAWRRPDGALSVWHPGHARDPVQTPWLLTLPVAQPGVRAPVPGGATEQHWPMVSAEEIGCRCVRRPCAPESAPREIAARQITLSGLPFESTDWSCDRPGARRQWSLAKLGLKGRLRWERSPRSARGRIRLEIAGRAPIDGRGDNVELTGQQGFEGQAGLGIRPLFDGHIRAKVWRTRRVATPRAAPDQTIRIVPLGLGGTLGALTRRPDGRFVLPSRLGGGSLVERHGGRLEARIEGGFVRVEWLKPGELWVQLVREVVLDPVR